MYSLTELNWFDRNGELRNILTFVHPIGSIYMTTDSRHPATLFGGTWVRWGEGRVPVGVSADDSDFNTVGKTGGEKEHQLTTSEMPKHRHVGRHTSSGVYTDHGQEPFDPPSEEIPVNQGTLDVEVQYNVIKNNVSTTTYHPSGSGPINDITYTEKVMSTYGVADNGEDMPHNNLQPYITCYMWQRIN